MADSKDAPPPSLPKGPSYRDTISSGHIYYSNPYLENVDFKKAQAILLKKTRLQKKRNHLQHNLQLNLDNLQPSVKFFRFVILTVAYPLYYLCIRIPKLIFRKISPSINVVSKHSGNFKKNLQVAPLRLYAHLKDKSLSTREWMQQRIDTFSIFCSSVKISIEQTFRNLERD